MSRDRTGNYPPGSTSSFACWGTANGRVLLFDVDRYGDIAQFAHALIASGNEVLKLSEQRGAATLKAAVGLAVKGEHANHPNGGGDIGAVK